MMIADPQTKLQTIEHKYGVSPLFLLLLGAIIETAGTKLVFITESTYACDVSEMEETANKELNSLIMPKY